MTKEILLIDDDAITNFVHQNIVEAKIPDIPIKLFYNGANALDYLLTNPTKSFIVFLDLNMPIMNGWEFLQAIETQCIGFDIQVHVLTSSIDPRDRDHALQSHMVRSFMEKPLDDNQLERFIEGNIEDNS